MREMSDATCGTCGYPLEEVRPGKHQCRVCEAEAEIERLRAEVERWKTLAKQRAADWVLLRRQYEDLEDDRY